MVKGIRKRGCPFLGEEKVVLCRAFPVKKPLPYDRIYMAENHCLSEDYGGCPIYQERAEGGKEGRICPFVELETMSYCKLFPAKKIALSGVYELDNPCTTEGHRDCPLFRAVAQGDLFGPGRAEGFSFDQGAKYLEGHFWVKEKGEGYVLGIDDFAQFLLGPVMEVRLPRVGTFLEGGDVVAEMGTERGVIELLSPLKGRVMETNEALAKDPSLVNLDPYGRGWLLVLGEVSLPPARDWEGARALLEEELGRLGMLLGAGDRGTMADGGEIDRRWLRGIDGERWRTVLEDFLKSRPRDGGQG